MRNLLIRPGDIFIADAHFLPGSEDFFALLRRLKNAPEGAQIIFLGDIFAALFGGVKSSQNAYAAEICALENFGRKIIFFEGNHDFALRKIFKNITIISEIFCPANFEHSNGAQTPILLQHGDVFLPPLTQFALRLLRSRYLLYMANLLDVRGWIFERILRAQKQKIIYKELGNFESISQFRVQKMLQKINSTASNFAVPKLIIEGHFHQAKAYKFGSLRYVNLPAYAQTKTPLVLDNSLNFSPLKT